MDFCLFLTICPAEKFHGFWTPSGSPPAGDRLGWGCVLRRIGEPSHQERVSSGRRMTSSRLRPISSSRNDERGAGGQTTLTRLVGWHHSTAGRKLTGRSPITHSNHLPIRKALEMLPCHRPAT